MSSNLRRTTPDAIVTVPPPAANQPATDHRLRASGAPTPPGGAGQPRAAGSPQGAGAIGFVVLLLILATTSQGAFAISRWAPLTLFSLAVLLGALLMRGGLAVRSRGAVAALIGLWGMAGWALLSMLWAASPADAFQGADILILYAAVATLPLVLPVPRRMLGQAAWALTGGIGAIAVYVLVRLVGNGSSLYLAGRLNGPINYRNATALLFAMAVLPCVVAAASRTYRRPVRAGALALATLCLGLTFLTQSRGILIGLAAGEVVILALGPDRVRRAWTSAVPLAAVAASAHWLLAPFRAFDGGDGFVTVHDIAVAGRGLLVATIVTFAVGMVLALFDMGIRPSSPRVRVVRHAARTGLAIALVAAVAGALAATGNPISYLHGKWDSFTSLRSTTPTTTRLLTVNGQRYDLWRVAVHEFDARPLGGVGAGNYSFGYYRERATNRNLSDPHSLLFSTLSELGAVGIALLALFLGGCIAALAAGWRRLDDAARRPAVAAAAIGAVLIGQSMVDWIWLIPGLTAIGILALGLAMAQAADPSPPAPAGEPRRRWPGRIVRIGAGATVGAAIVGVLALFLSDAYVQQARSRIADPAAELSAARTASALDPWSVTPHYLQASALETAGDRPAAYAQLRDALALEPANFATLGVLGDFEARGGNFAGARAYYRRALALDPLDTGLQQLARLRISRPPSAAHHGARRRR